MFYTNFWRRSDIVGFAPTLDTVCNLSVQIFEIITLSMKSRFRFSKASHSRKPPTSFYSSTKNTISEGFIQKKINNNCVLCLRTALSSTWKSQICVPKFFLRKPQTFLSCIFGMNLLTFPNLEKHATCTHREVVKQIFNAYLEVLKWKALFLWLERFPLTSWSKLLSELAM